MKNSLFKKIIAVLLALATLMLAGCSKDEPVNNDNPSENISQEEVVNQEEDDVETTDLDNDDSTNQPETDSSVNDEEGRNRDEKLPEEVIYSFSPETKTLTISGDGKMDFRNKHDGLPWDNEDKEKIETVIIEDGITSIEEYAFYGFSNLKIVKIGKNVKEIGSLAFDQCYNLDNVVIPDSVETIGDCAFSGCESLENITIGKGAKNIHEAAFLHTSLSKITVDKENKYYSSDSKGVLFNKNKTKLVVFPTGSSITDYSIPDSVEVICGKAFVMAYNLKSVTISKNVKEVPALAFDACNSLEKVLVAKDNKFFSDSADGILYNKDKTILVMYPRGKTATTYEIADGVKEIGVSAFVGNFYIEKVIIPDSVEIIRNGAFFDCYQLREVIFGTGIRMIEGSAFGQCMLSNYEYAGTREQWESITIEGGNETLSLIMKPIEE